MVTFCEYPICELDVNDTVPVVGNADDPTPPIIALDGIVDVVIFAPLIVGATLNVAAEFTVNVLLEFVPNVVLPKTVKAPELVSDVVDIPPENVCSALHVLAVPNCDAPLAP